MKTNKLFLLDSDILVNYSHCEKDTLNFIEANYSNITVSYVSYGEIIQGSINKKHLIALKNLLKPIPLHLGGNSISELALKILESHTLAQGIGINDSLIAATAITEEYLLVTNNYKHFKGISKLQTISLTEAIQL